MEKDQSEPVVFLQRETEERMKGFIETKVLREYFWVRMTSQVAVVETTEVKNPYPRAIQAYDRKIQGAIVPPALLGLEIRKMIEELKGGEAKKE